MSGEDAVVRGASDSGNTRPALLAGALAVLSGTLVGLLILGWRYIGAEQEGTPMAPLPVLSAVSAAAGPRFLFSIHGVSQPLGVAVSPAGDRIFATESAGLRETKVFDRDGLLLGALNPPGTEATSRTPVYVAVGAEGTVYVSDRLLATVHTYSSEGEYLGRLGPEGAGGAWAPLALAVDGQGRLLATDVSPSRHGVAIFGADGALAGRFGAQGKGSGEFEFPNGVAVDRWGRIVVADSNNGRLVVLDGEGKPLWAFGRGETAAAMGLPRGLVIDDNSRVYVADTINHVVLVFDLQEREARPLFALGSPGLGDGQFSFPNGLALDSSGRLYVADRENDRVQVWTY